MKILVLCESLHINSTSSGIVNSHVLHAIQQGGHTVHCLHIPTDRSIDWLPGVTFCAVDAAVFSTWDKLLLRIPKVRALPAYFSGFDIRFRATVRAWKKSIVRGLDQQSFDGIVVLGTGMSFAAHFAIASIDPSMPWVANFHDPYPTHHYPPPYAKKWNWINYCQARRIDQVMRRATKVSFPSERLLSWMSQFHPVLHNKSVVIPHPTSVLTSLPTEEKDEQVALAPDKLHLLHLGSLWGPRNPIYFIEAYQQFLAEDDQRRTYTQLSIIGSLNQAHTGIIEKSNANICVIPQRISYKKSLELMRNADVLILLEAVADVSPFMPGKLSDYIAARKAILALTPPSSETTRLLGEGYPYRAAADDVSKIKELLVMMWNEWQQNHQVTNPTPVRLQEYIQGDRVGDAFVRLLQ